MKNLKLLFLTILSVFLVANGVFAQSKKENFKVLSAGSQSNVEKPFIFVARDAKTYEFLKAMVDDLPNADRINFDQNAVVAAFAGTKPTGGYEVRINKTSQTNMIELVTPPKGAMVTQIITQPYKIVEIPVYRDDALALDSGANWANAMENFRVTRGDFKFSGGIGGMRRSFKANGGISVWTYGDYVTIFMNLRGIGNNKNRRLMQYTSGVLKNGKMEFARMTAGNFVDNPKPPFGISGTRRARNLVLNFESIQTGYYDGFMGSGKISAIKVR